MGRRAIVLSALCLLLLALMAANLVHDAVIEVLAAGEQAISRNPPACSPPHPSSLAKTIVVPAMGRDP
jgi:hypothetical protein